MATISLDELVERLVEVSSTRLREATRTVMAKATFELADEARRNIRARMEMRSRSLLTSVRSELQGEGFEVRGIVQAGGTANGVTVDHAHLQEEGGTILPVRAKLLAIPVDAGLAGRGSPRYRSPRQMPFAAFVPVHGRPHLRYLVIDRRNKQVFFLLVTQSTVPGKHFLRDALATVAPKVPGRLLAAAAEAVIA